MKVRFKSTYYDGDGRCWVAGVYEVDKAFGKYVVDGKVAVAIKADTPEPVLSSPKLPLAPEPEGGDE